MNIIAEGLKAKKVTIMVGKYRKYVDNSVIFHVYLSRAMRDEG